MRCERCDEELDAASAASGEAELAPKSGDISICFYCGDLRIFTGVGIETRRASVEEDTAARSLPEVVQILRSFRP